LILLWIEHCIFSSLLYMSKFHKNKGRSTKYIEKIQNYSKLYNHNNWPFTSFGVQVVYAFVQKNDKLTQPNIKDLLWNSLKNTRVHVGIWNSPDKHHKITRFCISIHPSLQSWVTYFPMQHLWAISSTINITLHCNLSCIFPYIFTYSYRSFLCFHSSLYLYYSVQKIETSHHIFLMWFTISGNGWSVFQ
jgi:hypothetical protein